MKKSIITAAFGALVICLVNAGGCNDTKDTSDAGTTMGNAQDGAVDDGATSKSGTVVDLATSNSDLSTLVTALQAADLVDTLAGDGPFTVLAPTNEAFDALPAGALDSLLADKEALTQVLLHHVIAGDYMAADLTGAVSVQSLAEQPLLVDTSDGVMFDDARVMTADLQASNGVVHVIDKVLMPPMNNIVEVASANPDFSTLVTAVQKAGLVDALSADGPFTVFAPTNAAFDALPAGKLDELLADPEALQNVLLYHVVQGELLAGDLTDGESLPTLLDGASLNVDLSDGVKIGQANVVQANVLATNGVIHAIDSVLIPE